MMSDAHSQQMDILIGFVVILFVVIFGTLILSQLKKSKKNTLMKASSDTGEVAQKSHEADSSVVEAAVSPSEKDVNLSEALKKTEENIFGRIRGLFKSDDQTQHLEEIEEVLYTSDLGPQTVQRLMGAVEQSLSKKEKANYEVVKSALKSEMRAIFSGVPETESSQGILSKIRFTSQGPTVLMIVGVNGAGKTTSIGKLSAQLAQSGKKVLVAAGDTFRAAAGGQLKVWTDRAQVEIFSPEGVTDPSAVAFDAVQKGYSQSYDVVIVDTAGRLHIQANLMEELKKMKRVMAKVNSAAPHEVLIVLDANSGQNALMQAKEYHAALQLTGAILTKMDGTAKGGVAVGLAQELKLPIKLIGVGERIQDLRAFDTNEYLDSILPS